MQKKSNLLWSCLAGIAVLVCFGGTDANAAGRSMVSGVGASTARMPTMPTMSINTVGTHAVAGVAESLDNNNNNNNNNGNNPEPTPAPTPAPTPSCDDGSVVNSDFTVTDCMQSILNCVQGGGLAHGINDLFNRDLRNSIINGMGVCAADIDRCVREVRVDCHNVYYSSRDVWLDFNSRVVQPEYYNFVLRKTGLTPNQAENVCGLLDKNVYGKSFAAVSASGDVTGEYKEGINAYNNNGEGGKKYPVGSTENTTANGNVDGVDGERGHYARWDATNGVCKIRVAAYNKDDLITNNWLWGALGDDTAAEVWQDVGSTFTCNKELFDFSLLNNTKTAALVGMGGGTLLGAGIGYATGHKAYQFDCAEEEARYKLFEIVKNNKKELQDFVGDVIPLNRNDFTKNMCNEIKDLYARYVNMNSAINNGVCWDSSAKNAECDTDMILEGGSSVKAIGCQEMDVLKDALEAATSAGGNDYTVVYKGNSYDVDQAVLNAGISKLQQCIQDNCGGERQVPCTYKSLKNQDRQKMLVTDFICDDVEANECVARSVAEGEVKVLKKVFDDLEGVLSGEEIKSTKLKNTLIGAGIGLGAGGVATAITAFVERNNITCRVGDGLNSVGFGKSFTIDSLKDFYVKWNLRVADTISPTVRVTTCQDWIDTCAMYDNNAAGCVDVVINYQAPGRSTTNPIYSACIMSGNTCKENRPVAASYGACENIPGGNGGSGSNSNQQSVSLIAH